jgi:predicted DNA-binding protein
MQYTVELAQPWAEALADVAKMAGKTESELLALLVYRHLEDVEDSYHAERAMEEFVASGRVTYSFEEVYKELEEVWRERELAS